MTKENKNLILEHNQLSMLDDPGECATVREYADLHGVHKHTVLNWIKAGKVPFFVADHGKYKRYYIPFAAIPPIIRPDRCA